MLISALQQSDSIILCAELCLVAQLCPIATPWTIAHQAPLSMGILQASILEWVAMPSSRGSFQPRDRTLVSYSLLPMQKATGSLPVVPPEKSNTSNNGNWGPLNWSIAVEGEKKKKKRSSSHTIQEREPPKYARCEYFSKQR